MAGGDCKCPKCQNLIRRITILCNNGADIANPSTEFLCRCCIETSLYKQASRDQIFEFVSFFRHIKGHPEISIGAIDMALGRGKRKGLFFPVDNILHCSPAKILWTMSSHVDSPCWMAKDRQTDRQTERQSGSQSDTQTDVRTDRQTHIQNRKKRHSIEQIFS